MRTIAIISQKGGAGKTTLAVHLATEAAKTCVALVLDTDPQATANRWGGLGAMTLDEVKDFYACRRRPRCDLQLHDRYPRGTPLHAYVGAEARFSVQCRACGS